MQKVVIQELAATLYSGDIRLTTFGAKNSKAWKWQYENISTLGGLRFDIAFISCKADISIVPVLTICESLMVVFSEDIHAYKDWDSTT